MPTASSPAGHCLPKIDAPAWAVVKWSPEESMRANRAWKANCGPHALAAALGLSLDGIRPHLERFRGWMNPTMIRDALESIGVGYRFTGALKTPVLCNGLNRLQWEGPWLNPGMPPAEAYRHTHWVAHFDGWVLCTAVNAFQWDRTDRWSAALASIEHAWHVTHHYELPRPDTLENGGAGWVTPGFRIN